MQEAHCPGPAAGSGARSGGGHEEGAEGPLGPTVAVLVVSLTIAAVGAYQLCGFGLHILNPRPRLFNNGFATAGVIVATMAAGAAVGNLVWLLTASRRHPVRTAPAEQTPPSGPPTPPRAAVGTPEDPATAGTATAGTATAEPPADTSAADTPAAAAPAPGIPTTPTTPTDPAHPSGPAPAG
ncbi:hypothetical protein [Streptomyces similanensis]|uniref:Uncharacterized protein n=1 Tax=Streptomyces similanensis TaxID=1274988 RepID=A0ABP9LQW5_9ACTN